MQEAILHGDLIVSVDDTLASYDRRKLPTWLRSDLTTSLADSRAKNSAVQMAAGDQAGARTRVKTAHSRLADFVRSARNHILAVPLVDDGGEPDADMTDLAERLDVLVSLGFAQGELGELNDRSHLLAIVDAIVANNASMRALMQVPTFTIARLTNWRAVLTANQNIADGGTREELTLLKTEARELLERRIARVRLYIAACSDLGEQDPILARYDFQPKRDWGEAQPDPKPDAPGTFTWDGATRKGTVQELPAHASLMTGWRQILGGEPEPCGQSETTEVNFAEVSPFVPNGQYKLWMTGKNSQGYGPRSNEIDWQAPE